MAAGADIVGANCGNGIANMIEITRQMRAAVPETPILIHANAGPPVMEDGKTVFKETPEYMASTRPGTDRRRRQHHRRLLRDHPGPHRRHGESSACHRRSRLKLQLPVRVLYWTENCFTE